MPARKPATKRTATKPAAAQRGATKPRATRKHEVFHRDGSLWARGSMTGDVMTGYWEWFRKDGTKLRSGSFEDGEQVGEWTTYDARGKVYKVTQMKKKGT